MDRKKKILYPKHFFFLHIYEAGERQAKEKKIFFLLSIIIFVTWLLKQFVSPYYRLILKLILNFRDLQGAEAAAGQTGEEAGAAAQGREG